MTDTYPVTRNVTDPLTDVDSAAEQPRVAAARAYRQSLTAGPPLTGKTLGAMFGRSDRWGRLVIADIRGQQQPHTGQPTPQRTPTTGAGPRSPRQRNPQPHPEPPGATEPTPATATATERAAALPGNAERKPAPPASLPPTAAPDQHPAPRARSISTWFFVLGALVGMVVSVDTSWRFFQIKVGVSNVAERVGMFAGIEILLLGCGWAMFEGIRGPARAPGPARWLAWALCAASGYAALTLSGWPIGPARVLFGPVLSVVALHFALGIELRAGGHERAGTVARIGRELRERWLSRLGLADDARPARERTKARAARRAAYLAHASGWVPRRAARLDRALRVADVAHDPQQRQRLLAELRTLQHAAALRTVRQSSPWQPDTPAAAAPAATAAGPETGVDLPGHTPTTGQEATA